MYLNFYSLVFVCSCCPYIETGGNINIFLNNTPENAGDEPKQKIRSRNNIGKSFITNIKSESEPTTFDSEIVLPKRKLLTEYYHNTKTFEILFLNNLECERAQSRNLCKSAFPKDNPLVPVG